MTTCALISDIHGNIDALDTVVKSIRSGPAIDEIICLGDIIGYCPGVNEVIDLLASLEKQYPVRYNLGSHDGAALGEYQFVDLASDADSEALRAAGLEDAQAVVDEYRNTAQRRFIPVRPDARNAMNWTLEHMSAEAKDFLRERLQPRIELEPGVISMHGSPRDPVCEYVRNVRFAQKCFESDAMAGIWLCFVGHTHLPVVWRVSRSDIVEMAGGRVCMLPPTANFSERIAFERATHRYIANVGSVGQPRDRDPRACYARFSSGEYVLEHVRVEYDIDAAAARLRKAGFSERLAERLYEGR